VVGKVGIAVVSPEELIEKIRILSTDKQGAVK
jgi:hypothetical protein